MMIEITPIEKTIILTALVYAMCDEKFSAGVNHDRVEALRAKLRAMGGYPAAHLTVELPTMAAP